jgi:hypothetical protein
MRKLIKLLDKTSITIQSNDTYYHGPFTIVELTDSKGHKAYGVSRCSHRDNSSTELGNSIARGRAEHALYNKLMGKKINSVMMG